MKTETFDLSTIDPKKLPELQGWKEKQLQAVKENPFVEIKDNESYEIAKKHRTALVTARTSLQKQDKTVASKLKELRTSVGNATNELIEITLPHEEKQQEEVKRYEAIKEQQRIEREEKEKKRINSINDKIQEAKSDLNWFIDNLALDVEVPKFTHLIEKHSDFDFEEFQSMFDEIVADAKERYHKRVEELQEQEKQRKENERLRKEAEKKDARFRQLQPYLIFVRDMDAVMGLEDDAFASELESLAKQKELNDKAEAEKREKESAEREKNRILQEKLDRLEREKADREEKERLANEAKERAEREEKERKEREKREAAERKANEERQKRLANDKKLLTEQLLLLSSKFPQSVEIENTESMELFSTMKEDFENFISRNKTLIESL